MNIRDIPPGSAGVLFLLPQSNAVDPLFAVTFFRVRVMMNTVNISDMKKAEDFANDLKNRGVPFLAFSAGRGTPLPGITRDEDDSKALLDQVHRGLKQ